jgi:hypothetical protein
MKFNKWTLGLAAVGAVSLASVAQAEEKANMVMTAVSSTALGGYVDTSATWAPGSGNGNVPTYSFNSPGKADGFSLNSVLLRINKPLDETEWAAGYNVDLFLGPDANFLGTTVLGLAASDFAIKQAYVSLRTPIMGTTGIDWKLGVFDNWIGYESTESPNNPNWTRSYGYTIEPTTFTGLMGTYKINDLISVSAGIANTTGPIIGGQNLGGALAGGVTIGGQNPPKAESFKTYMASVALTAPNDWGFIAGSTLYAGIINGWGGGALATGETLNLYAGATINTPVAGLKTGISFDHLQRDAQTYAPIFGAPFPQAWHNAVALYASYQLNEKWSFHARGEYFWQSRVNGFLSGPTAVLALTGTVQYDLWKNVISRLEVRWDHQAAVPVGYAGGPSMAYGGVLTPTIPGAGINSGIGGAPTKYNSYLVAANIIYKF